MTTQISVEDLKALLDRQAVKVVDGSIEPAVKVVDGSWALDGTDMRSLYLQNHIPGAQFFDLEAVSDHSTHLPHMAPSPQQFVAAVGKLGISQTDHVVVYDRQGLFSAARVWWTFKVMGHARVQVLSGGLPAWKAAGFATEAGVAEVKDAVYVADFREDMVIGLDEVRTLDGRFIVLDARSLARFEGTAPEPRAGLRSGHIPGSRSLPFGELIRDGGLKPVDELRAIFAERGVTENARVVTSCGSGVTAAILSMALSEIGHAQDLLYDGSWAEWGQDTLDTPVVTGPA